MTAWHRPAAESDSRHLQKANVEHSRWTERDVRFPVTRDSLPLCVNGSTWIGGTGWDVSHAVAAVWGGLWDDLGLHPTTLRGHRDEIVTRALPSPPSCWKYLAGEKGSGGDGDVS